MFHVVFGTAFILAGFAWIFVAFLAEGMADAQGSARRGLKLAAWAVVPFTLGAMAIWSP